MVAREEEEEGRGGEVDVLQAARSVQPHVT